MKAVSYGVLGLFAFIIAVFWWIEYDYNAAGDLTEPVTLIFPQGTRFEEIADMLAEKGVIRHPNLFKIQVFLRGKYAKFKAGEYEFAAHISPISAAEIIASGRSVRHALTIPEGLMTIEVMELVNKEKALAGDITLDIREGELLPETYYFSYGDRRDEMIMRMKRAMQKAVEDVWATRGKDSLLTTPEQLVTLASIVEKETGIAAERPRVAAVYTNRLKKGMLLQADPTTVYAVTQGRMKLDRALTLTDLTLPSPYNTYFAKGLPPGPIANPGKAALQAAMHPAKTDEFYFVATGKGGHNFARTAEEHQANVKVYREAQAAQKQAGNGELKK